MIYPPLQFPTSFISAPAIDITPQPLWTRTSCVKLLKMKHIELDEANEETKKMQGMQAYRYISSQRCHQYKWLRCHALSESSTPDLSEKTSLIDSPSTSTKQPASSCLPPDSTMPGAPMSAATTATAAAVAAP